MYICWWDGRQRTSLWKWLHTDYGGPSESTSTKEFSAQIISTWFIVQAIERDGSLGIRAICVEMYEFQRNLFEIVSLEVIKFKRLF